MESFGKILIAARESKGISIDEIEKATAISRQYLEALEEEQLDVFPGQTYASGFLRNYSDYLGCDTKTLLGLYHAKVVQEAPPPEDLLKIRKSPWFILLIVVLALLGVALLVFGGFLLVNNYISKKTEGMTKVNLDRVESRTYILTSEPLQQRIYKNDILEIPFNTGSVKLIVQKTLTNLTLDTPIGNQIVDLGEELELDVDGNGVYDLSIFLADISSTDESRGAEVHVILKVDITNTLVVPEYDMEITSATDISTTTKQTVLFEENRAYPFTLTASFRGACLFRYQNDRKDSVEDYFTSGDTIVTTANNSIRLWMSNANTIKLQVQGGGHFIDLEVGRPGQILVQDIKWIKEADGTFKLVVLEVD